MPITLPSYVAPNELIQSAWGNGVVNALDELDDEKADLAAAVFTGTVSVAGTAGQIRIRPTNDTPILDFYDGDAVTRYGIIDATSVRLRFSSDNDASVRADGAITVDADGGDVLIQASADVFAQGATNVVLQAGGSETLRGSSAVTLIGKTASNLATSGVEFPVSSSIGSVRSSISAAGIQCLYARHNSSADANAEVFAEFVRSGSTIGSVTQVSTTGVAYNTTSDERLKTVLRDVDDDETAEILRAIAPVVFEFNADPGVEHVGFIAQELARRWPAFVEVGIVTSGEGDPEDEGFRPWMVDLSKLVPLVVAGWQQLDRRLTALESQ